MNTQLILRNLKKISKEELIILFLCFSLCILVATQELRYNRLIKEYNYLGEKYNNLMFPDENNNKFYEKLMKNNFSGIEITTKPIENRLFKQIFGQNINNTCEGVIHG